MKLILIGGAKQSGKTTAATAIYGYYLTSKGVIPNANFNDKGEMTIVYKKQTNEGILFDIDSRDPVIVDFRKNYIDRHICHVSFAHELKNTCCGLFGLNPENIYGSNDQKNEFTHIKWADIKKVLKTNAFKDKTGNVTHREFMEVLGTNIARAIDEDCHIRSALNKLISINPEIGIIPDLRFENELAYFENNAKFETYKIRLKRNIYKSDAESELSLNNVDDSRFDLVIDEDTSLFSKNQQIIDFLINMNVLEKNKIEHNISQETTNDMSLHSV